MTKLGRARTRNSFGRDAIRAMFAREFATAQMVCIVEEIFQETEWAIPLMAERSLPRELPAQPGPGQAKIVADRAN